MGERNPGELNVFILAHTCFSHCFDWKILADNIVLKIFNIILFFWVVGLVFILMEILNIDCLGVSPLFSVK